MDSQFRGDAPSFGTGDVTDGFNGSAAVQAGAPEPTGSAGVEEDELRFAASVDKVQEVREQLAEFLVKFSSIEQWAILSPFVRGSGGPPAEEELEPHLDEGRRFVGNYLSIYPECERELILEKWRPAFDTASLSTATDSLTPSVTPPGSVTPTALTPREFLGARREVNELYHGRSPLRDTEWS
mmetsp:Transcript_83750/g.260232  ORF Transcript_83750/g.260232 Transcript_83750/m.260232 type:complete len:183 (+) Transcript_83750:65-613(+)